MDVSVEYADPVKVDSSIPNDWGELWSICKRGSSNVGNSSAELGSALEDALVLLSTSALSLEECEICYLEKAKECGKVVINQEESSTVTSPQLGVKTAIPYGNMLSSDICGSGKERISNAELAGQSSSESGNSTSTCIISLGTSKLVSAMKGSREKLGVHAGKLSVSWASDVYDPPATSLSHTVKSHNQQFSLTNKKSNRHKHKGKSPRSSSTDKKHQRKISRGSSKVVSY